MCGGMCAGSLVDCCRDLLLRVRCPCLVSSFVLVQISESSVPKDLAKALARGRRSAGLEIKIRAFLGTDDARSALRFA